MIDYSEWWIGIDVEGSDRDLIYGTNLVLNTRIEESHETPHARVAIWTGDLPNTGVTALAKVCGGQMSKH
jgi:hypothetical protein